MIFSTSQLREGSCLAEFCSPSPYTYKSISEGKHKNSKSCGTFFLSLFVAAAFDFHSLCRYVEITSCKIFPVLHIPACGRLVGLM